MEFLNRLREKSAIQKTEKFFPAFAFLGGFSWDSMTIGSKVYGSDLVFLSFYYVVALVAIYFIATRKNVDCCDNANEDESESKVLHRFYHKVLSIEWPQSWIDRLTWLVQFCFGNLCSALVICYFKSSGSIAAFIFVLVLAMLLVGNEFLKKKYENFGVCLAFFCLLGTMFFNFLIPHLVHGMGTFWFFLSTLLSVGICYLLWMKSLRDFARNKFFLIAPITISVVLSVSYLANWIAPVPLVLKQQIVCKNFDRETYSCDADNPDFWQRIGFKGLTIHKGEGDEIYFMSSVYAPAELKAPIEYRWYYKEPSTNKFKLTDKITSSRMVIRGGRDQGYRSYSRKKNIPMGTYRVETAYKDGAVIGSTTFKVLDGQPENGFVRDSLR
ncbi:DUF2914 domain-containing protein [Fibrobacter sp. UWB12]|uniref:DUF2914 domain-containing protein n=1 Tax=Fibrobacter sp. UWB12 TaxID=1896203 RepID=UPI0009118F0B|nr:DUF2914 domain-containing protein [Fibrobacter sp. UWB12]SHK68019.1 Protein of unknown function [Fibrobacter sp. UWB12]